MSAKHEKRCGLDNCHADVAEAATLQAGTPAFQSLILRARYEKLKPP
jgi:hypothetical protein